MGEAGGKYEGFIQGTLVKTYRRCGKANCWCVGTRGHGPVYYVSNKERGRTRLVYVPRASLKRVKEGIRRYWALKKELKKISAGNLAELREVEDGGAGR